jgi:hypothetical protein
MQPKDQWLCKEKMQVRSEWMDGGRAKIARTGKNDRPNTTDSMEVSGESRGFQPPESGLIYEAFRPRPLPVLPELSEIQLEF